MLRINGITVDGGTAIFAQTHTHTNVFSSVCMSGFVMLVVGSMPQWHVAVFLYSARNGFALAPPLSTAYKLLLFGVCFFFIVLPASIDVCCYFVAYLLLNCSYIYCCFCVCWVFLAGNCFIYRELCQRVSGQANVANI